MRIALYARVSTRDKDQNPETQLLRLRDFVATHPDSHITKEYVDTASANDMGHRTAWKALNDDAVLVFKLDRAFRSVKHLHDTLAVWDAVHVGFLSAQEGFDTTTALGRLLLNLLASLAEFELEMIRERVIAGMDRARKEGTAVGRPPGPDPRKGTAPFAKTRQAARFTEHALSCYTTIIRGSCGCRDWEMLDQQAFQSANGAVFAKRARFNERRGVSDWWASRANPIRLGFAGRTGCWCGEIIQIISPELGQTAGTCPRHVEF
ncbi:MAG: hypothetical protein C7B46_19095 [Sulfobacillus benefaciens]|uniref:Resolvase/invertase-type recombinase catalytic domain-containing protein n=1 Tax=Sulfobacillus benefaciens TaxID=453960 RepID=A0A2T2X110_9FIRM|nr:MAG: hypothetical protein C7B46_19095 [Sulfobacillus benefaciens]